MRISEAMRLHRSITIGTTVQPDFRPSNSGCDGARPFPARENTPLCAWMPERGRPVRHALFLPSASPRSCFPKLLRLFPSLNTPG